MTGNPDSTRLVEEIAHILVSRQHTVTTVESCTGGGIAHALTAIAGSSAWFEYGFVTYSNPAKTEMVGVSTGLLDLYGAVSVEVASAMASGGRNKSGADHALSVTGIAGPGGATPGKPGGTVCFGWAGPDNRMTTGLQVFSGDRESVRNQSVVYSLSGFLEYLDN